MAEAKKDNLTLGKYISESGNTKKSWADEEEPEPEYEPEPEPQAHHRYEPSTRSAPAASQQRRDYDQRPARDSRGPAPRRDDRDRYTDRRDDRRDDRDRYNDRPRRDEHDREARREREPVPLPRDPPFKAYVGNLEYDTHEEDVADVFGGDGIVDIVMIRRDGKFSGYCYVEFRELRDLEDALRVDGTSVRGRNIRVDVAQPKTGDRDRRRDEPRDRRYGNEKRYGGDRDRQRDHSHRDEAPRREERSVDKPAPAATPSEAAPTEGRKKLQLAPRSATASASASSTASSIFGGARPREEVLAHRPSDQPSSQDKSDSKSTASTPTASASASTTPASSTTEKKDDKPSSSTPSSSTTSSRPPRDSQRDRDNRPATGSRNPPKATRERPEKRADDGWEQVKSSSTTSRNGRGGMPNRGGRDSRDSRDSRDRAPEARSDRPRQTIRGGKLGGPSERGAAQAKEESSNDVANTFAALNMEEEEQDD